MKLFLLVVVMHLPPFPSGLRPAPIHLETELIGYSSQQACLVDAEKRAARQRQLRSADIAQFGASITGQCLPRGGQPE